MNPINVVILQGGNQHRIEGVETWWYEGIDLVLRFPNEETTTYTGGNVMGRF